MVPVLKKLHVPDWGLCPIPYSVFARLDRAIQSNEVRRLQFWTTGSSPVVTL